MWVASCVLCVHVCAMCVHTCANCICVCRICMCTYMCVLCVHTCVCVQAVYVCICVCCVYPCVHVCMLCMNVCTCVCMLCMHVCTCAGAACAHVLPCACVRAHGGRQLHPGPQDCPIDPLPLGYGDIRPAVPLPGAAAGGRPGSPQSAGSGVRGRVHVCSPACGRPPNCWLFHPQPLGISAEGAGRQADPPCDRDPRKPQAEGTRPWKCRSWVSAAVPRACTQISEDGG